MARHARQAALASGVAVLTLLVGCLGPVDDVFEVRSESWHLKIERRMERGVMGGAQFTLRSRPSQESDWRDVLEVRHDDEWEIPRKNLILLNPSTALFFFNNQLVVSTDAGLQWRTWSADADMKPPCPRGAWITAIRVGEDGNGTMSVSCHLDQPRHRELQTSDFGKNWSLSRADDDA